MGRQSCKPDRNLFIDKVVKILNQISQQSWVKPTDDVFWPVSRGVRNKQTVDCCNNTIRTRPGGEDRGLGRVNWERVGQGRLMTRKYRKHVIDWSPHQAAPHQVKKERNVNKMQLIKREKLQGHKANEKYSFYTVLFWI